jgi:serine O-acetyltransferase
MGPLQVHRIARLLWTWRVPYVPRLLKAVNFVVFNCVLPPQSEIGRGTTLWHSGLGIVVHPNTIIGSRCNIYNHIVIGGGHDGPGGPPIEIRIGDGCTISAGAKILCKGGVLRIGNNVTVAANAVVLDDVPDDVIVGGLPAKVIKRK